VAISLVILLTVLVSVSSLMVTAFKVGANSRFRQTATEVATSTLDNQTQAGASALLNVVGDTALPSVTISGQTYLAELEVSPYQPGSAGCQSPQGNGEAMLKVTVWVTWANEPTGSTWWTGSAAGLLVEETTLVAVPDTDLDPTLGTLLVTVSDASSNGVQGVSITATDSRTGTTLTAVTTASGCALFTNIDPDSWTVTGTKSLYIDDSDDWSTTTNGPAGLATNGAVTVMAATTTTVSWNYDHEATVTPKFTVTLAGTSPWLPTNLSNMPLTFYSSYFPTNTTSYTGASPAPVYPFLVTSSPSYYVVAGSCGAESAPDGANYTPGATTDGQPVSLTSGGNATVTFPLTPLDLVVSHNGSALSNISVSAAVAPSDANCGTGTLAMPTLGLGTTCVPGVACAVNSAARHTAHARYPGAILVATTTTTTITSSQNPSVYGAPVTFTAKVSRVGSGAPTGTVSFTAAGNAISGCTNVSFSSTVTNPGSGTATCTTSSLAVTAGVAIKATYNATGTFSSSNVTLSPNQVVNKAPTNTTLVSNPNPTAYGTSSLLTATVAANSPSTATPTGTVNFTSGGSTISGCGAVTLSGSGQATCTLSGVAGGSYSLAAVYAPSPANFNASTSPTVTQSITAATTTTTLTSSSSQNSSTVGASVTFTAAVSASSGGPATGTITFKSDGAAIAACSAPVALFSGVATCTTSALTVGNHSITALYTPTNGNNFSTSSGSLTQTVFSQSGSPSIISGLPYGVWVVSATYNGVTSSLTLTVTPGHIQVGANAPVTAGTLIVLAV
jgi:hypothetical protein